MNDKNHSDLLDAATLGEAERLLLHAAGELPAEAARALELQLQNDPALRDQFASLRDLEASVATRMASAAVLSASEEQAGQAIRTRVAAMAHRAAIQIATRPAVQQQSSRWRGLHINKWIASGIAAAVAVVGLAVWIATSDSGAWIPGGSAPADLGQVAGNDADSPDDETSLLAFADAFSQDPSGADADGAAWSPGEAGEIDRQMQALQLVEWTPDDELTATN